MQNLKSIGIGGLLAIIALVLTVVLIVVGKIEFLPEGLILMLLAAAIIL